MGKGKGPNLGPAVSNEAISWLRYSVMLLLMTEL